MFWCTADIGWVTGHSYIVYGPLANGAISLMFEGVPTYPDPGRFWQICEKYKVNQFYTAPTVIRSLIRQGTEWVEKYDLSSLRDPGFRRRADQSRSLDVVLRACREGTLPNRRYLVADRKWRFPHHTAARRHDPEAG